MPSLSWTWTWQDMTKGSQINYITTLPFIRDRNCGILEAPRHRKEVERIVLCYCCFPQGRKSMFSQDLTSQNLGELLSISSQIVKALFTWSNLSVNHGLQPLLKPPAHIPRQKHYRLPAAEVMSELHQKAVFWVERGNKSVSEIMD